MRENVWHFRKLLFATLALAVVVLGSGTMLLVPQESLGAQAATSTFTASGTIAKDDRGFEMVYVPSGTFQMGISYEELRSFCIEVLQENDVNRCVETNGLYTGALGEHTLEIQGFWMDLYEITIDQYQSCVYYGDCSEIDLSWAPQLVDNVLKPQIGVTWYDAMKFCNLRGARLPTEAEWEYAASGPDDFLFPWGNTYAQEYISSSEELNTTHIVGSISENQSWAGVYDMAGNAAEWVEDRYWPRLTELPPEDVPSEIDRVTRGGSWDGRIFTYATFSRSAEQPNVISHHVGFRCVRTNDPRKN